MTNQGGLCAVVLSGLLAILVAACSGGSSGGGTGGALGGGGTGGEPECDQCDPCLGYDIVCPDAPPAFGEACEGGDQWCENECSYGVTAASGVAEMTASCLDGSWWVGYLGPYDAICEAYATIGACMADVACRWAIGPHVKGCFAYIACMADEECSEGPCEEFEGGGGDKTCTDLPW